MKKMITCGICAAAVLSISGGVFAADLPVPSGWIANYGMTLEDGYSTTKEDIEIKTNGSAATGSLKMSVKEGEEETVVDLPNYVLATEDATYLNTDAIIKMVENLSGMSGLSAMAPMIGVTESWLELIPIDMGALQMAVKPYEGSLPELDGEALEDLSGVLLSMVKIDATETGVSYTVDAASMKDAAAGFDEFKETHLGFVGDLLTYAQDTLGGIADVDVKPVIRNYLDAAAEGIMMSNEGLDEASAKAMLDSVIDSVVPGFLEEVAEQVQMIPVADLWDAVSLSALTENLGDFEAKLTMDENGITYSIAVGEDSVNGAVEMTADGAVITLNQGDELVGSLKIAASADGVDVCVADAEDNVQASASVTAKVDGDTIDAACSFEVPSQDVKMTGYLNAAEWEDDGSLAAPEASVSSLDVAKQAAALFFASVAEAEE